MPVLQPVHPLQSEIRDVPQGQQEIFSRRFPAPPRNRGVALEPGSFQVLEHAVQLIQHRSQFHEYVRVKHLRQCEPCFPELLDRVREATPWILDPFGP
jgi:hypothetical protein